MDHEKGHSTQWTSNDRCRGLNFLSDGLNNKQPFLTKGHKVQDMDSILPTKNSHKRFLRKLLLQEKLQLLNYESVYYKLQTKRLLIRRKYLSS